MAAAQRFLATKSASQSPRIATFPVKFPVSREFVWRRVRSALQPQPTNPAPRDFTLSNARNARQWPAFANWRSVSRLPICPLPEQPGIFGIGCEIVCRSQRRSAKVADGVPDFCRQLIYMLRIPRRIRRTHAAAGNSRRHIARDCRHRATVSYRTSTQPGH